MSRQSPFQVLREIHAAFQPESTKLAPEARWRASLHPWCASTPNRTGKLLLLSVFEGRNVATTLSVDSLDRVHLYSTFQEPLGPVVRHQLLNPSEFTLKVIEALKYEYRLAKRRSRKAVLM